MISSKCKIPELPHNPADVGRENPCPTPKAGRSLASFVDSYRSEARSVHLHLSCCLRIMDFGELTSFATGADGKRSSHQRRIPVAVIARVNRNLRRHAVRLREAQSFDELLKMIEACAVSGFGKLSCYDTALRIGVWLSRMPERVYLHAGTRKGARALGVKAGGRSLNMSDLPAKLRELRPFEIEDFLCVFKSQLRRVAVNRGEQ